VLPFGKQRRSGNSCSAFFGQIQWLDKIAFRDTILLEDFTGGYMPDIRKSADSRNAYSEISRFCHKYRAGDPAVAGTETGKDVMGKRRLYDLLKDSIHDIKNGNILTEEEMDKELDMM
jgi:hypothetical protein